MQCSTPPLNKQAFSLVELSIVLVILGLLTGGILAGKSLIRAAELRSVITDVNRYKTAFFSFRDKYFAIPGDMGNATSFWGAIDNADGAGSDCFTVASTGGKTCNGNADGRIGAPAGGTGTWVQGELWHAWIQLADAGMVEGSYTGLAGSTAASHAIPGTNVPASRINNAGYQYAWQNGWIETGTPSVADHNTLFFGKPRTDDGGVTYGGTYTYALLGEEAWNIDTKMDDGVRNTGKIIGSNGGVAPWCGYTGSSSSVAGCGLVALID